MNVLFFIPFLSKSDGGIYQYSIAILKNLLKDITHPNNFFIYHKGNNEDLNLLAVQYPAQITLLHDYDIKEPILHYLRRGISRLKLLEMVSRKLHLSFGIKQSSNLDHLIKKYNVDLIHSPLASLPVHANVPMIATIHDVQQLHYPEYFTTAELKKRKVNFKEAIDHADAIIVSYEHIKKDIIRFFGKGPGQIHVCLLNMDDLWFTRFDKKDVHDLKEYHLPEHFILYPAATWQHKNHLKLLEAIHFLKTKYNILVNLVCTGHETINYPTIRNKVDELGLNSQVHFLGIVPDKVLYSLYHTCTCVVIPTMYEAGSFPLVESILMNIPVLCSDVTSLPATIGNTEFAFSPQKHIEMAEKIKRMIFDPNYMELNINNSKIQSVKLRNNNASEIVNTIYSTLTKAPA